MALRKPPEFFAKQPIAYKNYERTAYETGRIYAFDIGNKRLVLRYLPEGGVYNRELRDKALEFLNRQSPIPPAEMKIKKQPNDNAWFVALKTSREISPFSPAVQYGELIGAAVAVLYPYSFLKKEQWNEGCKRYHEEFILDTVAVDKKYGKIGLGYMLVRIAFENALISGLYDKISISRIWDNTGAVEKIIAKVEKELEIKINRI